MSDEKRDKTLGERMGKDNPIQLGGGTTPHQPWPKADVPLRYPSPEPGAVLKCLVCALDKPWGIFDNATGAAVCVDCRDKARRVPGPRMSDEINSALLRLQGQRWPGCRQDTATCPCAGHEEARVALSILRSRLSPEPAAQSYAAALRQWQDECWLPAESARTDKAMARLRELLGAVEPAAPDAGVEEIVEKFLRSLYSLHDASPEEMADNRRLTHALLTAHTAALRRERDEAKGLLKTSDEAMHIWAKRAKSAESDLAAAERLLDALANNGCGLPYPEMLALVRAYREQVREEAGLTFDRFQAANVLRCGQAFKHGLEDWSLLEWAGALAGEVGEAANICKKIRRHQQKIGGKWAERDPDMETLKAKLADEIGDAGAYLVLLAAAADLVLSKCVAEKFDAVSEAVGWNGERLSRSASQEGGSREA